jgi:hypothetical protein
MALSCRLLLGISYETLYRRAIDQSNDIIYKLHARAMTQATNERKKARKQRYKLQASTGRPKSNATSFERAQKFHEKHFKLQASTDRPASNVTT